MSEVGVWRTWPGGAQPYTGTRLVKVRIRCMSRADAEKREAQHPSWWKRWSHDGGPGDIIEFQEV